MVTSGRTVRLSGEGSDGMLSVRAMKPESISGDSQLEPSAAPGEVLFSATARRSFRLVLDDARPGSSAMHGLRKGAIGYRRSAPESGSAFPVGGLAWSCTDQDAAARILWRDDEANLSIRELKATARCPRRRRRGAGFAGYWLGDRCPRNAPLMRDLLALAPR
jgi:hypothetical protein